MRELGVFNDVLETELTGLRMINCERCGQKLLWLDGTRKNHEHNTENGAQEISTTNTMLTLTS